MVWPFAGGANLRPAGTESFVEDALPDAPSDPSLGKLEEPAPRYDSVWGSYDIAGGPISPLPSWLDLKPLSVALKAGKCPASRSLPTDFVPILDRIIAERADLKTSIPEKVRN